jgi:hypothetical protein
MRTILRFTKTLDIFGKPLSLKFDKKWNSHDTKFGGLSTLILILLIIVYGGILLNDLLMYG